MQASPMRTISRLGIAAGVICLGLLPALRAQETEVTVVVDLSPEGQKLLHPSPQQPAYYLPVMLGFKEEDGAYAHSERPLPINQIARQVAETLAQQGYLVAHPSLKFNAKHEVVYADDTVLLVPSFPNPGRPLRFDQPRDYPLTADMLQSQDGTYSFSRPAARGEESLLPLAQVLRHIDPGQQTSGLLRRDPDQRHGHLDGRLARRRCVRGPFAAGQGGNPQAD